jgi:hypothetical protein
LQACIAIIHLYLFSIIKFPKWDISMITIPWWPIYFGINMDGSHIYHLAKQSLIF